MDCFVHNFPHLALTSTTGNSTLEAATSSSPLCLRMATAAARGDTCTQEASVLF